MSVQFPTALEPAQVEQVADVIERVWREIGANLDPNDPHTEELRLKLGRVVLQIASREHEAPASIALQASQAMKSGMA